MESYLKWRQGNGQRRDVQKSSVSRTLYEWTSHVIDAGNFTGPKRGRPKGLRVKPKGVKCDDDIWDGAIHAEEVLTNDISIGADALSNGKESVSSSLQSTSDPINILSKTAKMFLSSQGITKAHDFLSTKSIFVSDAFVKWRVERDMVVLKGYGASCTISGWKSAVREEAKQNGMTDLLDVDPVIRSNRKSKVITSDVASLDSTLAAYDKNSDHNISHPRILMGLPYCNFRVFDDHTGTCSVFVLPNHVGIATHHVS